MSFPAARRIVASVATLTLLSLVAAAVHLSPDTASMAVPRTAATDTGSVVAEPPDAATPAPDPPSASPTASDAPTEEAGPEEAPTTEEAASEKSEPAEAAPIDTPPRSLFLAIGHGRATNGKLQVGSIDPRTGVHEIDTAAVIVEAMTEVLQRAPNLRLWAESGRDHPNLIGTVQAANRRNADDCIEIHQEWHKAPPGAFAHWYPGVDGAKRLADQLVATLREEGISTRHKWHKPRPGLYFLRRTTCRAVLVEVGRVGDFTTEELRGFGRALAHAYIDDIRGQA